jgi:hypothetical protein
VARVLSTAFCVALLAATAGAFALTEGAKTEPSPIYGTKVDKIFSPTCRYPKICSRDFARITFSLRKKQKLEVWIVHGGQKVATILAGRTYAKGPVRLEFAGVGLDGVSILPDGSYRPVVRLVQEHRTITLPNVIHLDTTAPQVTQFRKRVYTHLSPDGDGRHDVFRERYTLNGRGHGVLLVDGRQAVFTRSQSIHGVLTWNGYVDHRLVAPGNHVLEIAAQDAAGNRSKPFPFAVVTVRYVELGRTVIHVQPSRRFAVRVITDAKQVSWLFDRGRGTSRSHTLKIRAPRKKGTYHLFVSAVGHTARATVVVG